MEADASAAAKEQRTAPSSPKARRPWLWLAAGTIVCIIGVVFWQSASRAMRPPTITLPEGSVIEIAGGFTGVPSTRVGKTSGISKTTTTYDLTVTETSLERTCMDYWNRFHARLPAWAASRLKPFPAARLDRFYAFKPQALVLVAKERLDLKEWRITVKEDADLTVFTMNSPRSSASGRFMFLLEGDFPSDSKKLQLSFEFIGPQRQRGHALPISEITIANPFHGHRVPSVSRGPSQGIVGTQRLVAEHFRLSAPRERILQQIAFRIRCEPWRDADDGVQIWEGYLYNAAGGWTKMIISGVRNIPAEQAQEILCHVSAWPSSEPLRVRLWLTPRYSPRRPPPLSFEFKRVMVPAVGLGQPHGEISRSGNLAAKLSSAQNRSQGGVYFKITDWTMPPLHQYGAWYLRDSHGRTTHPDTGVEYRTWVALDDLRNATRITFMTSLPTNTEWFDVSITAVMPEMVELEFPPKAGASAP